MASRAKSRVEQEPSRRGPVRAQRCLLLETHDTLVFDD